MPWKTRARNQTPGSVQTGHIPQAKADMVSLANLELEKLETNQLHCAALAGTGRDWMAHLRPGASAVGRHSSRHAVVRLAVVYCHPCTVGRLGHRTVMALAAQPSGHSRNIDVDHHRI